MTVMSVARTEAIGAAAGVTNGVTTGVIVAAVTLGMTAVTVVVSAVMIAVRIALTSAVVAAMNVAASAVVIAVERAVRSAGIEAKTAVKTVLARSARTKVPVADTTVGTAPMTKREANAGKIKSVAANQEDDGGEGRPARFEVSLRPISAAKRSDTTDP